MKKLISILVLTALASCTQTETSEIPQEKMMDILYDLTVASSAKSTANKNDSVQYFVSYKDVLKKHQVDSLQFVVAQDFYRNNPEVYAVIYDSVHARLQKKLDEVRALPPEKEEVKKNRTVPVSNLNNLRFQKRKTEKK